jgi:hypothetical protein
MPTSIRVALFGIAALAFGFLAVFTYAMGRSCQLDGSGGTNCDVIVGVGIAMGVASLALIAGMLAAVQRLRRERRRGRPS